ncbi:hypothetical protein [Capnocytophaga leadbetteri]|uniref:MoaF-related domain-containing protein n=1 Tax=Capnocytophaga leadbetteri TaxID=327575 RepID=UPI0026EB872A|nr:hypothetical protein [Capnocytophaga leadbetteri]
MKKATHMLAMVALFTACDCPNKTCEANTQTTTTEVLTTPTPVNIIGKRAMLKYPALTAEVSYLSENEIYWKTTDDKGQVAEQTNALTLKSINATQYFLSWVENDGTTVSQVIDTEKGTVSAFLTYEEGGKRVSQLLEGTFELAN